MWKEKLESRKVTQRKKDNFSDWMYLPDLILEHIFKFLSYRVSTYIHNVVLCHGIQNKVRLIMIK